MEIRDSEVLKTLYRKMQILVTAIGAGVLMMAVVAEIIAFSQEGFHGYSPEFTQTVVPYALWGMGLVLLGLSSWIPGQMLKPKATPRANAMQLLLPQTRHQRMFQAMLISWALCDAAAVIGLVGFLLTADRMMFYTLWGLSLLLMKINFPTLHQWQQMAHQVGRMR